MSRFLVATVLALLWTAVTTAGDTPLGRSIDLNKPGALETLRRSNPAHYEKVHQILEGVLQQRDANVPRWMQTNFAAQDVNYGPIVLTSYPAQRRLSFTLDATRYEAVVILTNVRGDIVPAQ